MKETNTQLKSIKPKKIGNIEGIDWNAEKVDSIPGPAKSKAPSKPKKTKTNAIVAKAKKIVKKTTKLAGIDLDIDDDENESGYNSKNISGSTGTNDNAQNVKDHLAHTGLDGLYEVVVADGYTIQIDLDKEESLDIYNQNYEIIQPFLGEHEVIQSLSKSKKLHVTIKTKKYMDVFKRIAIQAILGSDLVREACNYRNVLKKYKNPILLIEPKENKKNESVSK